MLLVCVCVCFIFLELSGGCTRVGYMATPFPQTKIFKKFWIDTRTKITLKWMEGGGWS